MRIITSAEEMYKFSKTSKRSGKKIGFVPTMGCLHRGHISLMKKIRSDVDILVISIYVNPKQFEPDEDFKQYPRDLKKDRKLIEDFVDIIFYPDKNEIYPDNFDTKVVVENLSKPLCGKSRPLHFAGVTTVVARLFALVKPDITAFGQKDAQQALIIERMVKDLKIDTEIVICPIIREKDGLAISSRNIYLSEDERKRASNIRKSLVNAVDLINSGERNPDIVKMKIKKILQNANLKIDYIEILEAERLKEVSEIKRRILIAVAVYAGKTRLIDNEILNIE